VKRNGFRLLRTPLVLGMVLMAVVLAMQLSGCGAGNPYPVGSYERGQHFVEKENYLEAVQALESFVRHNPTDSLAAEAQFLKAMTTMKMKEYPLAAVEFQILRKDFPTSDRLEESIFQEGVAYFNQVGRVERDITGALDARRHFQDFLVNYPMSPYRSETEGYLLDISDLVVRKRLRQCKVFTQLHRHQAVVLALETVLDREPGSRLVDQVLFKRAEVALRLEDSATARTMYERLIRDFPDSPLVDDAQSSLKKVGNSDPESESEDEQ
jgi:outer membrane assembly lipoprotein YfiO